MKNTVTTDQYICDECGNTSPVFNESCPNCGAPMTSLDADDTPKKPRQAGEEGDDEFADVGGDFNSDGMESLDKLKAEEEDENDKSDYYGDDE